MSHYFSDQPSVTSAEQQVRLVLPDLSVELITDRGVFSADRIDAGTKLLLSEAPAPSGPVCVDVGCGYGPIAYTLAHRARNASIWAVDVNERARSLCARNVPTATVIAPDGWPEGLTIDTLWSNPPIRIGKAALHELLDTWLARLSPNGQAILVVQKFLGADSLVDWMTAQGYVVDRLASRQGYRLLDVRRPQD
jgi:16S rRNA (guanine1207-N2)-methyltransferase